MILVGQDFGIPVRCVTVGLQKFPVCPWTTVSRQICFGRRNFLILSLNLINCYIFIMQQRKDKNMWKYSRNLSYISEKEIRVFILKENLSLFICEMSIALFSIVLLQFSNRIRQTLKRVCLIWLKARVISLMFLISSFTNGVELHTYFRI